MGQNFSHLVSLWIDTLELVVNRVKSKFLFCWCFWQEAEISTYWLLGYKDNGGEGVAGNKSISTQEFDTPPTTYITESEIQQNEEQNIQSQTGHTASAH